jgi:hypothetical protein
MVVGSLRNLDRIVPGVQAMAVRLVCGDAFTDDVREASLAAYTTWRRR